jgi:hypothetical protein
MNFPQYVRLDESGRVFDAVWDELDSTWAERRCAGCTHSLLCLNLMNISILDVITCKESRLPIGTALWKVTSRRDSARILFCSVLF